MEPDIIDRFYEYLIRKFAKSGGQSAGEFYTPHEIVMVMGRILDPEPSMEVYDSNTGSAVAFFLTGQKNLNHTKYAILLK